MIGSEKGTGDDHEQTYIPTKLSLLISRPSMPRETTTPPPPLSMVSVPFQWEEAPGKPRHCHTRSEPDNSPRTLELPPRLLFSEAKSNIEMPSPTTVLDGPYVGRALSFTSSYRTPRDYWNSNFGSTRWSGFRKINQEETEDILDLSSGCFFDSPGIRGTSKPKVKIARASRRGSFFSLTQSKARSHLWASIYESLKQVVPWRRSRQQNQRKWASKIDST